MPTYGKKIREAVAAAKQKSRKRYACPSCSRTAVKRVSAAIFQCGKCGARFASGTYEFKNR